MIGIRNRAIEMSVSLVHITGLSGAATFISTGQLRAALLTVLVASFCVLLLTGVQAVVDFIRQRSKVPKTRSRQPRKKK
jgi:hypothetical protein